MGSGNGAAFYFLYDGISPTNDDVVSAGSTTSWSHVVKTSRKGKTVKGIGLINADYRRTVYIDINTFMLQEGVITNPAYEPYFEPVEITIPQSVKGKLGNTVSLKFAGLSSPNNSYGDAEVRDELVVKPPQVLYVKNIAEYQVTGEEEVLGYNITQYGVHAGFKTTGDAPHPNNSSLSLCNCAGTSGKVDEPWFDLWPGYPDGISLSFNFPGYNSIEEMVMTMKQKFAEGNPITILYPKVMPDGYDISGTELGQQLLALATHKGVNYLKITGNLAPSKIDLSYWRQILPDDPPEIHITNN